MEKYKNLGKEKEEEDKLPPLKTPAGRNKKGRRGKKIVIFGVL